MLRINDSSHHTYQKCLNVCPTVFLAVTSSTIGRSVSWFTEIPHSLVVIVFSPRRLKFGMEVKCACVCVLCLRQLHKFGHGNGSGLLQKGA